VAVPLLLVSLSAHGGLVTVSQTSTTQDLCGGVSVHIPGYISLCVHQERVEPLSINIFAALISSLENI
jgi:hypothetical protein